MNLLDSINDALKQALCPGYREPRVHGWENAEKFPMPRDCEKIMLDDDPRSDHIYMKKTDADGGYQFARYKIVEDPIPKFEPDMYVTKTDFSNFKEDILDAINSLKQCVANNPAANNTNNNSDTRSARPYGGNKQSGKSDNGVSRSEPDV